MMTEKIPLSVVVLTKNNAGRITACLDSVTWAQEIVIVDDQSTDDTRDIARRYTDKIFIRGMDVEGKHRNWAYAQARHAWVFSLDSDEIVTPELKDDIARVVQGNPRESGFTVQVRNFMGDSWIRWGGWYPAPKLRLFRKDKFRYEEVDVHPRAFLDGPCGHLKTDILHHSYKDMEDFISKLNNLTTREAQKWFDQGKPMRLGRFLWRTIDRFMRTYVGKRGYRDGFLGFCIAFYSALYQFLSYLKYRELALNKAKQ
jgi:glycosyltransferase involved in cell wall biosynthesis